MTTATNIATSQSLGTGRQIDFDKLAEPFEPFDVEWRIAQAGKRNGKVWARILAYITNRAVMHRLDEVCGPANWRNEYQPAPTGGKGVLCGLSIRVNGEWVTKWDGAENTDVEATKGGLSDAMKRAAVQWGIGRYLYELGESWANIVEQGGAYNSRVKVDDKQEWISWNPPELKGRFLPENWQPKNGTAGNGSTNGHHANGNGKASPPTNGTASGNTIGGKPAATTEQQAREDVAALEFRTANDSITRARDAETVRAVMASAEASPTMNPAQKQKIRLNGQGKLKALERQHSRN